MSTKKITVELDWEHALLLPMVLDSAINRENDRLRNMKTDRWRRKTVLKISAATHTRDKVQEALIKEIKL